MPKGPAAQTSFKELSPAEFFYLNRDLAGFTNPGRALYSAIRELVENSLDAVDLSPNTPHVKVFLNPLDGYENESDPRPYLIKVADNGPGILPEHVPNAFGRIFYGSKFILRQSRGMFGMGGTMAILYGQITTNRSVEVATSTDGLKLHNFRLLIDIQANKPIVLDRSSTEPTSSTGTTVTLTLEGDYARAAPKIHEYIKQTAMATPYAQLEFQGPDREFIFTPATSARPPPPRETPPHPHGLDMEALRRMIEEAKEHDLLSFLSNKHLHRVGRRTASKFLSAAGFDATRNPKSLSNEEIVALTRALHRYEGFLPPDASCLSPLGEELLIAGIQKELKPEFCTAVTRPPAAYSGYPFILELGLAFRGPVLQPGLKLYRLANRIPLLYDEASDVSWKVVHEEIDWKWYRIPSEAPLVIITHLCSTRVPYKTVGKEFIADRPEVERELKNGLREVLRRLSAYLSRQGSLEMARRRLNIFGKYLPLIARFATELSGQARSPRYRKLLGEATDVQEAQ